MKFLLITAIVLTQAECDELARRSETVKEENESLRSEISRMRTEYEQLLAENAALKVTEFVYFLPNF